MVAVVGGYYHEFCHWPQQDDVFGSGGRAAVALAFADTHVDWYYYCPSDEIQTAKLALSREGLSHHPTEMIKGDQVISFDYFHPLSSPVFSPGNPRIEAPIPVEDEVVLRFGFMEGDAIVEGKRVVFDPQSPNHPVSFRANGSKAESLAIVLNDKEVLALGQEHDEIDAVANIFSAEEAAVIIVKAGPHGCRIYQQDAKVQSVPAYKTESVYKVGSGDVFSAAFTYHWGVLQKPAAEAADVASRCVARYCSTRFPSVAEDESTRSAEPVRVKNADAQVYIAGPFFTMAELWLVEQTCAALDALGVNFFSPLHEAGLLRDYADGEAQRKEIERVVNKDLEGLKESSAVFAIIDGADPGTIFEVGWAVKEGIPVIALSQNPKAADQTMIRGSKNCSITDDFSSAIYMAAWAAWEK